jgi:thiol:disulfide interchange protein
MKSSTGGQQVKELLLELPVIKEENISNYRQTIISTESHPSMFVGSTNETAEFVAKMSEETERFILSSQGIARVEKRFLMNNYRVGEQILEIQYQQFWNNGTSSIYCEHVMRIGQDIFEVFGSTSSASRMKALRASSRKKAIRASSGKSTASFKSFTEKLANKKTLGFILLVAGILLTGVTTLLGTITIVGLYLLLGEFKPGMGNGTKIIISIVIGIVITFLATLVSAII